MEYVNRRRRKTIFQCSQRNKKMNDVLLSFSFPDYMFFESYLLGLHFEILVKLRSEIMMKGNEVI